MGIITTCLLSLTTLLPQQPAATPAPAVAASPANTLAHLLPAGASAAVLVEDLATARTVLMATPFGQLWQQQGAGALQRAAAELFGGGSPLSAAQLDEAFSHGIAVACTQADGQQGFVVVVETGAASGDLARALAQAKGDSEQLDGVATRKLALGNRGTVQVAMSGSRLIACTHRQDLSIVLRLCSGADTQSLAVDSDFRAIAGTAADGDLATLFVRTHDLVTAAGKQLPAEYMARAKQAIAAFGIADLGNVYASWRLQDGELLSHVRCSCPQLDGLLGALVGNPYRLDARVSRFVPAKADGFVAAAIDLGTIARQVLAVVARFSPDFAKEFDDQVAQLKSQLGFDLRLDVFDNFAGQLLIVSFANDSGAHAGAMIEVKDATRLAAVLQAAAGASPMPLTRQQRDGVAMYLLPKQQDGRSAGFAAVDRQLIVADDRDTLTLLIDSALHPKSNPDVAVFLQQQPKTATWIGRNRVGGGLTALLASMAPGMPRTAPAEAGGYEWFTCGRDSKGIAIDGCTALAPTAGLAGAPRPPVVRVATTTPGDAEAQPAPAVETVHTEPPAADELEALRALEAAARPDTDKLLALLQSQHPTVVARAAWIAGKRHLTAAVPALAEILGSATDLAVRQHCAAALCQLKDKRALAAATAALSDDDVRVRTLAAMLLGNLGSTAATDALLGMIDEREHDGNTGKRTDVVAAILALADLGTAASLLPTASAITHDDADLGTALAYMFQRHSPSLQKRDEAVLLMAVLTHPATALRRYAIQRLGELRDPSAASALQGRLASEDRELQPVLEVALAAVRGDTGGGKTANDLWDTTKANFTTLVAKGKQRWAALDETRRMLLLGCAGVGLLALLGFTRLRARARRRARVEAAAALVAASPDLIDGGGYAEADQPEYEQEYVQDGEQDYETVGAGDHDDR